MVAIRFNKVLTMAAVAVSALSSVALAKPHKDSELLSLSSASAVRPAFDIATVQLLYIAIASHSYTAFPPPAFK